ncbi:MAG: efflux RND transporter periplasmic adaptor subunit [Anaerolineae bacterium]|nr:efflux RND transporter periplasmic adaptor subunit [Anaerolineae bacterium]
MKRRLSMVVLVVALLAAACVSQTSDEATPTPIPTSMVPDKPTYVVERGTVENKEQFTARVSPIREESLYFKKGGYIEVVYADRGDWVEEGTILAELEVGDVASQLALAEVDLETTLDRYAAAEEALERQLYSARTALRVTELRLERAKATPPVSNLISLRYAVDRSAETLEEAKIAYKEALDRPWEPQRVRDSLIKNVTQAERAYEEAKARYDEALVKARQVEATYKIDLALLEIEVEKAKQEIAWLERGVDPSLLQGVESAELRVERLEAQIQMGQLVAPFDGELTSFNVIPGQSVEARKAVAVIADPSEVDITANLSGNQMSLLEENTPCEVTFSSRPGEIFTGIIQQLPYPYGTGGGSVRVEDEDERTHILLDDMEGSGLEAGDLVKVTVLIEQSVDTLWLPPAAIRTFEGRQFVMVRLGDRLQKVDVKLGVEGEDRVEVIEGLEEGQIIEGL